jgi:hypothetical protein
MVELSTIGFLPWEASLSVNQRWKYHTVASIAMAVKVALVINQSVVVYGLSLTYLVTHMYKCLLVLGLSHTLLQHKA